MRALTIGGSVTGAQWIGKMPMGREPLDLRDLFAALQAPIVIPIIPYKNGVVDIDALKQNMQYLLSNNALNDQRMRAVASGGTSYIQHMLPANLHDVNLTLTSTVGPRGAVICGAMTNPIEGLEGFISTHCKTVGAPDAFMLMPITGIRDPDVVKATFLDIGEPLGETYGARFILYLQDSSLAHTYAGIVRDSPHFVGIKVGTTVEDVPLIMSIVGNEGIVTWGGGDLNATAAAVNGVRGHTSGIANFSVVSDLINNAYRAQNIPLALSLERLTDPIEHVRSKEGKRYNVTTLIDCMNYLRNEFGIPIWGGDQSGPFKRRGELPPNESQIVIASVTRLHRLNQLVAKGENITDSVIDSLSRA